MRGTTADDGTRHEKNKIGAEEIGAYGVVEVVSSICDLKFRICGIFSTGTCSLEQWDGE